MKVLLLVLTFLTVYGFAIDSTNPVATPTFRKMSHIISTSEDNVTTENYFHFNCPYNDENITIQHISYKFQSNSSNFTVMFYDGNMNNHNIKNQSEYYWQLIGNHCSYYCEANYTLYNNASQCFIFSGFDSYNDTMLISYEIVEEYLGPLPESPEPSPEPPQTPNNPPTDENQNASLSPGAIAGIVVGSVAFVGLIVCIAVFFVKKYDMCNRNVVQN